LVNVWGPWLFFGAQTETDWAAEKACEAAEKEIHPQISRQPHRPQRRRFCLCCLPPSGSDNRGKGMPINTENLLQIFPKTFQIKCKIKKNI